MVLEGEAPAASAEAISTGWRHAVTRLTAALGWPMPVIVAEVRGGHFVLAFTAPGDVLLAATEVNEWAWNHAAEQAGYPPGDPLLSPGDLPRDERAALDQLAAMAAAERKAPSSELALATPADRHVALITGSNGKTTTTRLVAAMMAANGWRTGWSCTDGVFIEGREVESGDWSGPTGAQRVISDPAVEAAALETARGGILRRGLGVTGADVAVVTNIEADHFGEYGVHSLADLAMVKLVSAKGLRQGGVLVLNADDETLSATPLPPSISVAWFSPGGMPTAGPTRVIAARRAGNRLMLDDAAGTHDLGDVAAMPITAGGTAVYNIANLLAASLAASRLGLSAKVISSVLHRFGNQAEDNAGRLMRFEFDGIEVLVDYAHNPTGLRGLLAVARARSPQRLLLLLGQAGNRDDGAIASLVQSAWEGRPDRVIIKELEGYRRGRGVAEVPALIEAELRRLGATDDHLVTVLDEVAAVEEALRWARAGDMLVLPVHGLAARAQVLSLLAARAGR